MALDANDIKLLSNALTAAIRASGGLGQRWEATASRVRDDTGSPEDRANSIRAAKNLEDNNKLTKELANMIASNTKSVADLQRFTDVQSKVVIKAINAFDDVGKSTEVLTKQLKEALSATDANTQKISKLAGNMNDLADALAFTDLGKHMADLSKSLDANSNQSADDVVNAVEQLENTIKRNGGNGVQDISAELKKFTDEIAAIAKLTRAATQHDVDMGHAISIGDKIRDDSEIKKRTDAARKSAQHQVAQDQLRDLAIQAQTKGIEASIATTKKSTSIIGVANKRMGEWVVKVSSAAYILDQLIVAGAQLIKTWKTSAGTGTEKGVTGVIGRDWSSLLHGLSPEAVQEIQVRGARTRSAMGRNAFDESLSAGANHFFGVTGDRDQAAKLHESTLSVLNRSGVKSPEAQTAAASDALKVSLMKLQYITGMTGEQMAHLTDEIAADADVRQGLKALNEQERAATITGIAKMFEENAQRGISIEQSKAMLKAQMAMSDPHSPKARIKNAAKIRALGGALGMDTGDAADLILASGNEQLMKKQLQSKNPGMTDAQAHARYESAVQQQRDIGTRNEQALADNGALGLSTEALGIKMPELKPLFDGTFGQTLNQAAELQGRAATDMMAAVTKFADGSIILGVTDRISNALKTMIGPLMLLAGVGLGAKVLGPKIAAKIGPSLMSGLESVAPNLTKGIKNIATKVVGPSATGAMEATVGSSPIVAGTSAVSKAGKLLGRLATPITAAASMYEAYNAVTDKNLNTQQKSAGVGGAMGGGTGALVGAAIGQGLIPIPVVGALLGGIAGGYLGDKIGSGIGGKVGDMISPSPSWDNMTPEAVQQMKAKDAAIRAGVPFIVTPVSPSISPTVNTPTSEAIALANSVTNNTNVVGAGQKETTPDIKLREAIEQMNTTLASILTVLEDQNEVIAEGSDKSVEMQKRLQRALKSNNFAGASPADGAAATYNA